VNAQIGTLYHDLVRLSGLPADQAIPTALRQVVDAFGLLGASFYSHAPANSSVVLRAHVGFNDSDYESFQKGERSACATAVAAQKMVVIDDVSEDPDFVEKQLAARHRLRGCLIVPLVIPEADAVSDAPPQHRTMYAPDGVRGLICAYPAENAGLEDVGAALREVGTFVAHVYATVVRRGREMLRRRIIDKALVSDDLNSFLYRAIEVTSNELSVEAGSVFLWDDRCQLLRLHSTTGLETERRKSDTWYSPTDDAERRTVHVATGHGPTLSDDIVRDDTERGLAGKYEETVELPRKSFACVPILDWRDGTPWDTRPLGAFRVLNKHASRAGHREVLPFTWEDATLLGAVAEVIGTASNLLIVSQESLFRFDRVMHGLANNVEATYQKLRLLDARPNALDMDPHLVRDASAHMLDVKWQISRIEHFEEQIAADDMGRVLLMGEVLAKAVNLAESVSRSFNVADFQCTHLMSSGFGSLHPVRGNVPALTTVFRNVLENAIKYSDPSTGACIVEMTHWCSDTDVMIGIRDQGIGVPDGQEDQIFREGVRADNAITRRPASSGIGLAQSLDLMKQMGGDLTLDPSQDGTMFIVRIPRHR